MEGEEELGFTARGNEAPGDHHSLGDGRVPRATAAINAATQPDGWAASCPGGDADRTSVTQTRLTQRRCRGFQQKWLCWCCNI